MGFVRFRERAMLHYTRIVRIMQAVFCRILPCLRPRPIPTTGTAAQTPEKRYSDSPMRPSERLKITATAMESSSNAPASAKHMTEPSPPESPAAPSVQIAVPGSRNNAD